MMKILGVAGLGCLLLGEPAAAAGLDAAALKCDYGSLKNNIFFNGERYVFDDSNAPGLAIRLETPTFMEGTGEARLDRTLRFSQQIFITDPGEGTGRVKVKSIDGEPIGWVN